MNRKYLVGIIAAAMLGLIPATASATTSTDVCVSKLPFVSLVTPLSGACGTEYSLVAFGEEGPAGPTGPTGATGATGPEGPEGKSGSNLTLISMTEPITIPANTREAVPLSIESWTQSSTEIAEIRFIGIEFKYTCVGGSKETTSITNKYPIFPNTNTLRKEWPGSLAEVTVWNAPTTSITEVFHLEWKSEKECTVEGLTAPISLIKIR